MSVGVEFNVEFTGQEGAVDGVDILDILNVSVKNTENVVDVLGWTGLLIKPNTVHSTNASSVSSEDIAGGLVQSL